MASSGRAGCGVSILIAARNMERYIDVAIHSARRQTIKDIEILVVDDKSMDRTKARARAHARADRRVRILDGPGRGPGAARNVALRQARGEWLSVLDGDDFMHPRRLERLLEASNGLDLIADNLFVFHDHPAAGRARLLLESARWARPSRIEPATFVARNTLFSTEPPLGYLKPLMRRAMLSDAGLSYDESLRIAEDYDLTARLLAAGARYGYVPEAWYFYRRHDRSTSYRIQPEDAAAMIAAAARFHAALPEDAADVREASLGRSASLERAAHFTVARDQIKERHWRQAARTLWRHPRALGALVSAVRSSLLRRLRERFAEAVRARRDGSRKRRALLLWQGDAATAAPLQASVRAAGTAPVMMRLPPGDEDPSPSPPVRLLLRIAHAGPYERIYCDQERLLDLVPYALSPGATVEVWRRGDVIRFPGKQAAQGRS